jgi:predicted SAM-dependent methyltransferase
VPDALHPDPAYRAYAGKGGPHNHQIFYDHGMLAETLQRVGFRAEKLEYWTEGGAFVGNPWDPAEGRIARSRWNDRRNADGKPNFTSLIVDGVKPG